MRKRTNQDTIIHEKTIRGYKIFLLIDYGIYITSVLRYRIAIFSEKSIKRKKPIFEGFYSDKISAMKEFDKKKYLLHTLKRITKTTLDQDVIVPMFYEIA